MEKSLEGSLVRFEVPDILTFLKTTRRTGVLVLERPGCEAKVFFRSGDPVLATSNREGLAVPARLASALSRPAPEIEMVLARGRRKRLPEGQAIVDQGVVSDSDLSGHLRSLMCDCLFDTFGWRRGTFAFFDGIEPPAAVASLPTDLHSLIMEGERRLNDPPRLDQVFTDHEMIVEAKVVAERREDAPTLAPAEWKVFHLVDGRRSLDDLCRLAGGPQDQTLEVLRRMLLAGYVALRPGASASSPASTASPAAQRAPATTRPLDRPEPAARKRKDKEAVPAPLPTLVVKRGGREATYPIAKKELTLGRHRACDVVLSDAKVSSSHARVEREGDDLFLVDLGSRNGSFVNERRVTRARLAPGDEIRLGTTRLTLRVDDAPGMA